jgi:NAD(P)H-hydrate repair Nnr-like enzyme with NAD(P)H-hydrate epimerase domain
MKLVNNEKRALTILLIAHDAGFDFSESNPNRRRAVIDALTGIGIEQYGKGAAVQETWLASAMKKIGAKTYSAAVLKAQEIENGGGLMETVTPDPQVELPRILAERAKAAGV